MGSGNKLQRQRKGPWSLGENEKGKGNALGRKKGGTEKAWACSKRETAHPRQYNIECLL